MKQYNLFLIFLFLFASCSKEFQENPIEVPQVQAGSWYEIMTNGDHFKSLKIDESGKLSGEYYIHDDSKSYIFSGIYTGEYVILHLYRDDSDHDSYIDEKFAVVKFDNSELVLASYFKGYFFTRDSSANPFLSKPNIEQLLGKWEWTQDSGSKTYYYFYGDGTGRVEFKSINEAFSDDGNISHWFTINDWLFIKSTPRDPSYNKYSVYKYKFKGDDLLLYPLDINAKIKDPYKYVRLDKYQPQSNKEPEHSQVAHEEVYDDTSYESSEATHESTSKQRGSSGPMQVWRQCMNCLGSGQCPYCYGQGHILSMYGDDQVCPVCTGGRCSMCAGQGGHYEVEY